tara:strand:+ start:55 stop:840 length:786 start_codon:yes stop_codon:yes gene_type:complete
MYYPKNKIITGLYSNLGDFVEALSGNPYEGPYYKLFSGETYSGKTPLQGPNLLLIKEEKDEFSTSEAELDYNPPLPEVFMEYNDNPKNLREANDLVQYNVKKNINIDGVEKLLPFNIYRTPQESDYEIGVFKRYFAVKNNELKYLEIDKKTFDKLINRNNEYYWQLYTPFTILWTIAGDRNNVSQTNKNITELTEFRLGKRGLTQFLKGNYLQFYKQNEETSVLVQPSVTEILPIRTTPSSYTPPPISPPITTSPNVGGGY